MTPKTLYKLLDGEPKEDVDAALAALRADYERPGGLQIVEVAGGYQIVTRPELHEWVRRLFHERTTQKLSVQALETLAVIAYKQPVTAPEIAEIRGVKQRRRALHARRAPADQDRRPQAGRRPAVHVRHDARVPRALRLNDLTDLPKVEEMSDALGFELPLALAEPTAAHASAAVRRDVGGGAAIKYRGARAGGCCRRRRRNGALIWHVSMCHGRPPSENPLGRRHRLPPRRRGARFVRAACR